MDSDFLSDIEIFIISNSKGPQSTIFSDFDDEGSPLGAEKIFVDDKGELCGNFRYYNEDGLEYDNTLEEERKKTLENLFKSSGILISFYETEDKQIKKKFTSACFFITQKRLITTRHSVIETFNEKGIRFFLSKILVFFRSRLDSDKTILKVLEIISRDQKVHRYHILEWASDSGIIDSKFKSKLYCDVGDKRNEWKILNDLAIFEVIDDYQSDYYVIPKIQNPVENCEMFIVGYQGSISFKTFVSENSDHIEEKYLVSVFNELNQAPKEMIASNGKGTVYEDQESLGSHQCPTICGSSGGIVCDGNDLSFFGVHLGGFDGNNYFITTHCKLFLFLYFNYGIDRSFFNKHKEQLQPIMELYLKHFKHLPMNW